MPQPVRKPLRRTALTLTFGGLGLLAVMVVAGLVASANGQPAGPGHTATWNPGESVAFYRPIGPSDGPKYRSTVCDVGGTRMTIEFRKEVPPTGAEPRAVTCDQDVILQAGVAKEISKVVRSNLIMLPVAMVVIGLVLFLPRLLWTMAWFSTPRSKTRLDDIWGR